MNTDSGMAGGQTEKERRYKEALSVALRYVSHKDRTEYETAGRLRRSEYSDETVSGVISFLKNNGYLDDKRYAEYYLVCYKDKRSLKRIRAELSARGIDRELIDSVIEDAGADGIAAVRSALAKQMARRGISDINNMSYEESCKVMSALSRQGYSAEDIYSVMNGR